jgi:hypothetical protein
MAQFSFQMELRHSFWLASIRRAYTVVLLGLLSAMDWPLAYRIGVVLCLLSHVLWVETRPRDSCRFQFQEKGRASIWRNGDWLNVMTTQTQLIHPWLTVFSVTLLDGETQHWVVMPDSCSSDEFRRLRIWLKWEGSGGEQGLSSFQNTVTRL